MAPSARDLEPGEYGRSHGVCDAAGMASRAFDYPSSPLRWRAVSQQGDKSKHGQPRPTLQDWTTEKLAVGAVGLRLHANARTRGARWSGGGTRRPSRRRRPSAAGIGPAPPTTAARRSTVGMRSQTRRRSRASGRRRRSQELPTRLLRSDRADRRCFSRTASAAKRANQANRPAGNLGTGRTRPQSRPRHSAADTTEMPTSPSFARAARGRCL